ncbi:MAG: translation elongation factor Ts [Deltaproteobacteria bacterium]|jgi:elongation factor Ts|nr:translation elongation factor Ts [Deltaproteobacteria bacterium]
MEITAKMVKELREKTNAGMMDCKKALTESDGDMEKAKDWLREHGLATVSKRAGREAREGVVVSALSEDKKTGAILEFNTETDFVAKLESFMKIATNMVRSLVATTNPPATPEALLNSACPECGRLFSELITNNTATTGEKSELRRFDVLSAPGKAFAHAYNHAGNKLSVMVILETEKDAPQADTAAHDMAMQIAAANPLVISREHLPPETIERERNIYLEIVKQSGKPEKIWDKIVEGQFQKFYKETVLLDQDFIREPKLSVRAFLDTFKETLGKITIHSFIRYQLAEELVKTGDVEL